MHHKNPFVKDYDFDKLINDHKPLEEYVFVNTHGNKSIRFGDKNAVKALNTALLKSGYGVSWDIPENYLCPPIPGRLDYLLYIEELLTKKDVHLLDIGTGANLIYPILATCHFNWKCTASEVDPDAIKNAQDLIDKNPQLSNIEIRHQLFKKSILNNIIKPNDFFDVVVCNPPFYKSMTDAHKKNSRKVRNLKLSEEDNRNFAGRSSELWFKGGEVAFIKKMVEESTQFKSQAFW
ncbi:MAG: RlmF-related methyltransferase, partial [Bacteroidia bacterium]|nr:RlmF-related methyltransferase [Bacteroidia bacterium]